ncbi:MAG TPA: F0F1 ATP synthase subunit B [Bacteroidales bacterium]|jgi:F-type H+-transporting ATPase subunit b|nr:F0F1 ATP synthase subunit B [Bacteroidales bacterium]OQC57643.1 MAG: ATP synthase subunit b [Bacteroidetes bacterium ADurb.Bin013]MBP9000047.1 F0F1 ATP synthase subunit B [Bacteroidales bacterium]MBV6455314.1 ATP synthase subunit b [Bacteroidales bacterium]MCZ2316196.1 F0F1 ATP synthase subunit B [Bacteroidales bacterium]
MDLMIPDSGLLFWMLIAFGILFFILARYGWPLITGVVERRNERIAKALSDAAAARQLLATLKQQEEKILQQSRDEQARLVEQTEALRIKLTEQAREAAQEESRIILEKAREQIHKEKEMVMQELRLYVASLSVEVAEKILRKQLEPDNRQIELINQLIDETIKPRA